MNDKYIHKLIRKFFENEVSGDIRQKFGYWLTSDNSSQKKKEAMLEIWENHTGEKDERTAEELKKIHRRIRAFEKPPQISWYKRFGRIAAIFLLPLVAAGLTYMLKQSPVQVIEPELVEYFIPYGEQQQLILSDGSEVWINAGSLLIYEKDFLGNTRTLFLNGEANFKVAKNPDKPFIVKTSDMEVEALGTYFNVRAYPEAENISATLSNGSVRVSTREENTRSFILSPDEQLIYNRKTGEITRREIDAARDMQWTEGYLVFQASGFEEIIQSIERKFSVTVNYETEKFAGRTFTIRFTPEERLREILDVLESIIGFKYIMKENTIQIIH